MTATPELPDLPDAAGEQNAGTLEDTPELEEAVADDTTVGALQTEPDDGAPDPLTPRFEEPAQEE